MVSIWVSSGADRRRLVADRSGEQRGDATGGDGDPRTTRRAAFIRFTLHNDADGRDPAPQVISPVKRQSMVNQPYPN